MSLDDRGSKLQQSISLTAALLVAALGALGIKGGGLDGVTLVLFAATVVVLVGGFWCGVLATRLVTYEVADVNTLTQMVDDRWSDGVVASRNITAWLNTRTIDRLRSGNNFKARYLHIGIVCQGIGVLIGAFTFVVGAAGALRSGLA